MDLKTQIEKVMAEIDGNVSLANGEKLYYLSLTLNELRKAHLPTLPSDDNLQLLTPSNATSATNGIWQETIDATAGPWMLFNDKSGFLGLLQVAICHNLGK